MTSAPEKPQDAPQTPTPAADNSADSDNATAAPAEAGDAAPSGETDEVGGPQGPEPTRFGDWERNGRCSDF